MAKNKKNNPLQKSTNYFKDIYSNSSDSSAISLIVVIIKTVYFTIIAVGQSIGDWLYSHDKNQNKK